MSIEDVAEKKDAKNLGELLVEKPPLQGDYNEFINVRIVRTSRE